MPAQKVNLTKSKRSIRQKRIKHLSRPQMSVLLKRQNHQCYFCGCKLTHATATKEHLQPKSRGGSNNITNLAAACSRCNHVKGDLTEQEFKNWILDIFNHWLGGENAASA